MLVWKCTEVAEANGLERLVINKGGFLFFSNTEGDIYTASGDTDPEKLRFFGPFDPLVSPKDENGVYETEGNELFCGNLEGFAAFLQNGNEDC